MHHRLALVAVVPKDKLTIKGPIKKWSGSGSSGKAVHRLFCSECGSPIAHDPDAAPEIIALKAGTLDAELKKNLKPVRLREKATPRPLWLVFRRLKIQLFANRDVWRLGYRDLDGWEIALLPGTSGQAIQAHA